MVPVDWNHCTKNMSGTMAERKNIVARSYTFVRQEGIGKFLLRAKVYVWRFIITVYWVVKYDVDFKPGWRAAISTELPIFRDLLTNLRDDDVFYDIGADTGLFTCLVASKLGPEQVVAFEPGDGVTELERRLTEGDLQATVVEKAISQGDENEYHAHEGRVGLLGNTEAPAFPSTNAREILAEGDSPLPTVVKIDVFGAEGDVVRGLEEILSRDECRLVYLELHLPMTFQRKRPEQIFENYLDEWSLTEVVRILFQCGFEVEPIYLRSRTDDLFIRAYKPDH